MFVMVEYFFVCFEVWCYIIINKKRIKFFIYVIINFKYFQEWGYKLYMVEGDVGKFVILFFSNIVVVIKGQEFVVEVFLVFKVGIGQFLNVVQIVGVIWFSNYFVKK